MGIETGDRVLFRLASDTVLHYATIVSKDDAFVELKPEYNASADILPGQYLMISDPDTDIEYYGEVLACEGAILRLKRMWMGKRGYFRIDDIFPVIWRVTEERLLRESMIFSGYCVDPVDQEVPDETVSPRIWKMLVNINAKLDLALKQLSLESEGLVRSESIPVNISASGIRFTLDRTLAVGDVLELKMLLPAYPPVGVFANGRVVRAEKLETGGYEVSLHFINMNEEVREVIIQYTLKRQRQLIGRERRRE